MLHISVQWDCEGSESTAMHHKYQFFGQPEKNDEAIPGKSRFWAAFGYLWCFLAYFGSSKIFLKDQLIHNYIIVLWKYEKMCQFLENPNFEQISTTCPFGPLMFIHISLTWKLATCFNIGVLTSLKKSKQSDQSTPGTAVSNR